LSKTIGVDQLGEAIAKELTIYSENVIEGIKNGNPFENAWVEVKWKGDLPEIKMLLTQGESISTKVDYKKTITAPVQQGKKAGSISYILNDKNGTESVIMEKELIWGENVKKIEFKDILEFVLGRYCKI